MTLFKRIWCIIVILALAASFTLAEEEEFSLKDIIYASLDDESREQWDQWEAEETAWNSMDDEEQALLHLDRLPDASVDIDPSELETNDKLPTDTVNILLLGLDSRKDVLNNGLSDVVMILSFNKTDGSIKLTSILRDTYVSLPGYTQGNRINTAFRFGAIAGEKNNVADAGPKLAMRTVNRNFDMNIEHFVTVNIFGLAAIIDSLGGIDIELTKAEANRINYELRKEPMDKVKRSPVEGRAGMHHLDGMQAVTFARIRGIDNDMARTERQRKLMEVVLNHVLHNGLTLDGMVSLMETALPYIYTNIPPAMLFELGYAALSSGLLTRASHGETLFSQFRIPMDKGFTYQNIDGMSVIFMSDRNKRLNLESLHQFIYGQAYLR
ncbi:MAG: LCP family protein [Clostridia bacterium]|nr:LCP family protein [Clostridia bacterium]